jgi:hypothetical protein
MSKTNFKSARFPHVATVREERRRIAAENQGTIPTNIAVKKQTVPKTIQTPPPPPLKI